MEHRIVKIHIDAEQMAQLCEIVGAKWFIEAIGYLSTWNLTFPVCEIHVDRDLPDLVAYYFNDEGTYQYVIGAVWHGNYYGFHS